MSSTIMIEGTDISLTKYARGAGKVGYQVTWRSSDKEHLFDYLNFETIEEAYDLIELLKKRV